MDDTIEADDGSTVLPHHSVTCVLCGELADERETAVITGRSDGTRW